MKNPFGLFKKAIEPGRASNTFTLAAFGAIVAACGCIYCAVVGRWFIFALLLIFTPVFGLVAYAARDVASEEAVHAAERLEKKRKELAAEQDEPEYDTDDELTLTELDDIQPDDGDGADGHD